jgi:hypothetical protein
LKIKFECFKSTFQKSDDYGKDLTSVQNLQKKNAIIEADYNAHQERIDGVGIASEQFCQSGHFDAENIRSKKESSIWKYWNQTKEFRKCGKFYFRSH